MQTNHCSSIVLTRAFMAPALKLWWNWGLFSRAKYTSLGKRCPSISTAVGSLPSISICLYQFMYNIDCYIYFHVKMIRNSTTRILTCRMVWWSRRLGLEFHSRKPLCSLRMSSESRPSFVAVSIRSFISSYNFCNRDIHMYDF